MTHHFRLTTIEIAKRFKFFKRSQKEDESATEYMGQLRRLGQTCNFGAYLEMALRDQFVCDLNDGKCQRELLCDATLTAETALKKARVSEVVLKEMEELQAVKEPGNATTMIAATDIGRSTIMVCYRCGELGHSASVCKFKAIKCHACQKIGHIARVCRLKNKSEAIQRRPLNREVARDETYIIYMTRIKMIAV